MVVSAGIAAAATIGGAYMSSKGAKDSANAQINASKDAEAIARQSALDAGDIKAAAIKDSTSQQQVGLDQVRLTNFNTATDAANTQTQAILDRAAALAKAAQDAQGVYAQAVQTGSQAQIDAAKQAMDAQIGAANQANAAYQAAVETANKGINDQFAKSSAQYQPYIDTGLDANSQLRAGTQAGGDFNRNFTAADFVKDPGYDFRRQEGQSGVENSAAARGGLLSGDTLRAVTDYNQNFASNEYQNAYTRFNNDMNTRFTRLSSLADRGMSATGSVAALGADAARSTGANTIAGGSYAGQTLRDIGGYNAANATNVGNIQSNAAMLTGTSAADLKNQLGGIESNRISDVGNTTLGWINATGKNNADYESNTANLTANGTLAIGNAKADALTGANNATVDSIKSIGNANSAAASANGQIWGSALSNIGNNMSSMYMMNNMKKG